MGECMDGYILTAIQVLKPSVSKNELVFIGSPIIDSLQEMLDRGLTLTSFALHDTKSKEVMLQKDAMLLHKKTHKDANRRSKRNWFSSKKKSGTTAANIAAFSGVPINQADSEELAVSSNELAKCSSDIVKTQSTPPSPFSNMSSSSLNSRSYNSSAYRGCASANKQLTDISLISARVSMNDMAFAAALDIPGGMFNPRSRLIQAFREVPQLTQTHPIHAFNFAAAIVATFA